MELRGERVLKEYGCNFCSEMNYYNGYQRCRVAAQVRFEQQQQLQLQQQVSQVSFRAVDVKELEE